MRLFSVFVAILTDHRRPSRSWLSGHRLLHRALAGQALLWGMATLAFAQDAPKSFVENFERFDRSRWFVSDGWTNGDYQNCTWSKNQVKVTGGILTLEFTKRPLKDRDYACAEVQTKARYDYGVYEARLRTPAGSGLDSAFFTYIGPMQKLPHDEIDFEILTKNPSKVQLNSYVGGVGKNEELVEVPGGADQGFNDYAFVWEQGRLRWYINGKLVRTLDDPAKVPSHPSKIFFNLWGSDTFTDWLGPFADPGKPLVMEIDRVAFTRLGEACQFPESVACSLQ